MGKHASRRRASALPRLAVPITVLAVAVPVAAAAGKAGIGARADLTDSGYATSSAHTSATPTRSASVSRSRPAKVVQPQAVVPSLPPLERAPVQKEKTPKKVAKADKVAKTLAPLTFRVASLNVLGASNTAGAHDRYAAGSTRIRWAADILAGTGITVAGLQELQPSQYATLRSYAPGWGVWPGPALGRASTANSIIWRADQWEMVEAHAISVPYFFGHLIPMPYIKLRNLATGREVWVGNVHNPADAHGNAAGYPAPAGGPRPGGVPSAAGRPPPGAPPAPRGVFRGDMNDRERYFCPMTASSPMHSASGGGSGTPCAPPDMPGVDWVMGSTPVSFSNYHRVTSGLITRVTDHGLVYADASLAGSD